jgi:hypothetical protein
MKKVNFAPWHIQDPIEVEKLLLQGSSYYSGWKVNKDGTVNCNSEKYSPISAYGDNKDDNNLIKIKYRRAKNFSIVNNNLSSLWGCPDICSLSFELFCSNIKTLEHLPVEIGSKLLIFCPSLEQLNTVPVNCGSISFNNLGNFDILKRWKEIEIYPHGSKVISFGVKEIEKMENKGLLNLCLLSEKIGNNELKYFVHSVHTQHFPIIQQAFNIISKYSSDILECQEQLITNGLRQYAKI